jgi:demethylmenaquinone methyltransferase / 2-methoxy-6-polyprenyl-1,4-benzoquinol methylase
MDERGAAVQSMFGTIARKYDLVNDLISMGQHRLWKRLAIQTARPPGQGAALDLCTGTGDLALALSRVIGPRGCVVGVDFCAPMLEVAAERTRRLMHSANGCSRNMAPIELVEARAEQLPLADGTFDSCTVAFGLRNVSDLGAALREIHRVLKPGGRLVSLDCSTPDSLVFGAAFNAYFNHVVPLIGAAVNSSRAAYTYLPRSVVSFPQKRVMCSRMCEAGFMAAAFQPLSGGAVALHVAVKAGGAADSADRAFSRSGRRQT